MWCLNKACVSSNGIIKCVTVNGNILVMFGNISNIATCILRCSGIPDVHSCGTSRPLLNFGIHFKKEIACMTAKCSLGVQRQSLTRLKNNPFV